MQFPMPAGTSLYRAGTIFHKKQYFFPDTAQPPIRPTRMGGYFCCLGSAMWLTSAFFNLTFPKRGENLLQHIRTITGPHENRQTGIAPSLIFCVFSSHERRFGLLLDLLFCLSVTLPEKGFAFLLAHWTLLLFSVCIVQRF